MKSYNEMVNEANQRCGYPPQEPIPEYGCPPPGTAFDELIYETFSTLSGKALLEFLEKNLLCEPIWEPLKPEKNCYFMEGRNNLIRMFINRKKIYKERNT